MVCPGMERVCFRGQGALCCHAVCNLQKDTGEGAGATRPFLVLWEPCAFQNPLGLPQMTPVVCRNNQQPRAHAEAQNSNEWVVKTNSVQVKGGAIANHHSQILLRAQERLQGLPNGDLGGGDNLFRSLHLSLRWCVECADKKPAKPSRLDRPSRQLSCRSRLLDCCVKRRGVQRVSACKVIETLRDAPCSFTRLPVALHVGQPTGDSFRLLVRFLKIVQDAFQVGWRLERVCLARIHMGVALWMILTAVGSGTVWIRLNTLVAQCRGPQRARFSRGGVEAPPAVAVLKRKPTGEGANATRFSIKLNHYPAVTLFVAGSRVAVTYSDGVSP